MHRGTGVFSWLFYFFLTPSLARDSLSRSPRSRARLALALASRLPPFDRKTLRNCTCSADPGLLNETKVSWFSLSCISSYQNGWLKQTFFKNDINIQIRRFFSVLVESKSCGKYCLMIIRIGTNTALLAFSRSLGTELNDY